MNLLRTRGGRAAGVVAVAAALVTALAGCSGSSSASNGSGGSGDVRIFMAPKFTGLSYFEIARAGGEEAAKDVKAKFQYVGSNTPSATAQIQTLQNAVAQKPSALVVAAIDENAVAPVLKQAMKKGTKVVTFDADAATSARDLFVNQMSYEKAAETMLDAALKNDPNGGRVAFIAASPSAPNHKAQIADMKKLIDTDPRYSKLKYVDAVQYANDDEQKSFDAAVNLMQSVSDLKFIISPSAVSLPAAAQAVVAQKKQGKVYATGFALPSSMKQFVTDGSVKAFAMWDPKELGYVATVVANDLATGKIKGKEGDVVDAGKAGKFTVGANGEILYNKPLMFTKDNIAQYNF
jgi:rhamnose transport system substrate-binding protein